MEKSREGQRVIKAEKKLVLGSSATDLTFISTSLPERQSGTACSRNTYGFAKRQGLTDHVLDGGRGVGLPQRLP